MIKIEKEFEKIKQSFYNKISISNIIVYSVYSIDNDIKELYQYSISEFDIDYIDIFFQYDVKKLQAIKWNHKDELYLLIDNIELEILLTK